MGRYALSVLSTTSALAWAAVVAEAFADVLTGKQFAALCVFATLATALTGLWLHSRQVQHTMVDVTGSHVERMEQALKDHAAQLSRHQSLLERMVGVWNHGNVQVDRESKAWAGSSQDTGPFPIYRNGSMS